MSIFGTCGAGFDSLAGLVSAGFDAFGYSLFSGFGASFLGSSFLVLLFRFLLFSLLFWCFTGWFSTFWINIEQRFSNIQTVSSVDMELQQFSCLGTLDFNSNFISLYVSDCFVLLNPFSLLFNEFSNSSFID